MRPLGATRLPGIVTLVAETLYIWQTSYTITVVGTVKVHGPSIPPRASLIESPTVKLPNPAKLRIVLFPDPVLKKVAGEVRRFSKDIHTLSTRMFELMRIDKGVGLAAPQVGVSLRLFVCNPTGEPGDDLVCVNPRFLELSGAEEKEEGCLSIPGATVTMRRATHVVMEACDADGRPFQHIGTDLQARIWQHEMDHLDGRLIIDNMSPADEIVNRRAIKQLKEQFQPLRSTR